MNVEQELKILEETISKNETEVSKAQGSKETLLKRLVDEEGINTLEEAETILKKLETSISSMEEDMVSKIAELKEIYEW